ncbi:carboxypeptidase-like regulatory domain-containing protein [Oscillatoria amoena NRMC-F 0135]|nr:carboxypeptidase-like regulatory domain-containing protein [Oscillatoria amoena NRMC-F 0135]
MNKRTTLSIPKPCHEDWEKMTTQDKGRFCSLCQKTVVDFSHFSDKELIDYFRTNHTANTCGRLNNTQLERPLVINRTPKRNPTVAWGAALFALLASSNLAAQEPAGLPADTTMAQPSAETDSTATAKRPQTRKQITIKGQVTDKLTGETLAAVIVRVKDYPYGAATDIDGNFSITLPPSFEKDSVDIEFKYIGYTTVLITGVYIHKPDLVVNAKLEESCELSGEVMVTVGLLVPAPTFWERVGLFFKKLF